METDKRIIDIDDSDGRDDRPQEIPSFSIEEIKDKPVYDTDIDISPQRRKINYITVAVICGLVLVVTAVLTLLFMQRSAISGNRGLHASISDEKNIELLKKSADKAARGTTLTSDSILGVAFDMFSLDGLRGSLEEEIPDTTDKTLVLFMRSADYHPDGSIEGSFVMNGERLKAKSRLERSGYVALSSQGRQVIGISQADKVATEMEDEGGSFFRQFILLGDGQLPVNFYLHGKVERGAIGRKADGSLHYILTRHKETMYDFADALREYGFVDAIYITGGNAYNFYRSPDGRAHLSEQVKDKIEKYSAEPLPAPLLVFRTAK